MGSDVGGVLVASTFSLSASLSHSKMPFVTLLTNLKASALPADSMSKLVTYLAPLLNKPVEKFNWVLETDKAMSKGGPEKADKPFVWLKLESINSYDDPEKVKSLTPLLYSFLESELKIEKDWLIISYYKVPSTHVANQGKTL